MFSIKTEYGENKEKLKFKSELKVEQQIESKRTIKLSSKRVFLLFKHISKHPQQQQAVRVRKQFVKWIQFLHCVQIHFQIRFGAFTFGVHGCGER